MYNVCTIMYTHIRSQASDWNCCVKRLFLCTTVQREREREMESVRRQREGVCFEIDREGVCVAIERGCVER